MGEPGEGKAAVCRCPFCDVEIEMREESVICVACKVEIAECVHCGEPVRKGADTCPQCGESPR